MTKEYGNLCKACGSKLNKNAQRCASCGHYSGYRGALISVSTIVGAIITLLSLGTIAVSLYVDVLEPRRANLSIRLNDAVYTDIVNLTCDPLNNEEKPYYPRYNGGTPGSRLLIEGSIYNSGNIPAQIRIIDGFIYSDSDNSDGEEFSIPIARFEEPSEGSLFLIEIGATVPFTTVADVSRINSRGAYFSEIVLPVPPPSGRLSFGIEKIDVDYLVYAMGERRAESTSQKVNFYLEPFNSNWRVDGDRYPESFYCP